MTSQFKLAAVLGLIIALVASSAGGAWHVRSLQADAAIAALTASFDAERDLARQKAADALAHAEASGREAVADLQSRLAAARDRSTRIKTEIRHEQVAAARAGDVSLAPSGVWVRLYDDALRAAGSAPDAAGEPAGDAAPAGAADREPYRFDVWDVAAVHAENAQRWAECRSQLEALIGWERDVAAGVVMER